MEIRQKFWLLALRLSRSLKFIWTNIDRSATYDFLLVIHSDCGPISYRFPDKKNDICKIIASHVFNALTDRVSLGIRFCNGAGVQKTRMMPLPDVKKCDDMWTRLNTVPASDRRTDCVSRSRRISCWRLTKTENNTLRKTVSCFITVRV